MGKTRQSANLVSDSNIFVDITNDRVGIGTTNPSSKLEVSGTTKTSTLTITESDDSITSDSSISSWIYQTNFSVSAQESEPRDIAFGNNGSKMYVLGNAGNDINEYNLGTPWDVSTATYVQVFSVGSQEALPYGLYFKPDGTKFYICGTTADSVYEYNVGTAWNISTASYVQSFSVTAKETDPNAVAFSSDGTKMYVTGTASDSVHQYNLSSAWNISTAVFSASFSVSAYATAPQGLDFSSDGTKMYVNGSTFNRIIEYNLGTAWSVSTASFSGVVNTILLGDFLVNGTSGLHVEDAQGKAYITDYTNDRVFQLDTTTAATKFTGSRFLFEPDIHLENDLVVYKNIHSNSQIYARNGLYSFNYGYVAGTLDVRGAIDLADNDILRLGSSDDWEMYHDATSSTNYIDLTVGDLNIRDDGTAGDPTRFYIQRTTGNIGISTENPQYSLDVNGSIRFGGSGNSEGILRAWSGSDVDIDSLLPGSTFGSIFEGSNNGHVVIGIRDNDVGDSFSIISGGGNYQSDTTYDTIIAYFGADGDVGIGTNNPSAKLEVSGVIKDAGGNVRSLPNNAQSTSYVLAAGDIGELINITTGGVTVPASVFSAGNSVTIYNNSGSSQTITQGSGATLRLAGTATTGNRTLAQRGITTITCVASNEFVISGAGLS